MKKGIGVALAIGLGWNAFAQVKATVSGEVFNAKAGDSLFVSQLLQGGTSKNFYGAKMPKGGKFTFQVEVPAEDYYVIRVGGQTHQLVVRNNSEIKIYGDAAQLAKHTNIVGSEESSDLQRFMNEVDEWNQFREDKALKAQQDPANANKYSQESNAKFEEFKVTVNAYYQENLGKASLIGLLSVISPEQDFASYELIVQDLYRSFNQSPTVKNIYAGYTEIKRKKDEGNPLAMGKDAPDFEELMLDRKTKMKLSDLKGKVVLLDFWASWCGPCRRENPNVVALYEKYKDKGFTVMSVSLDDNLERWKQAIEQDKLSWPNHVSDLKKWQSAAGKKYNVTGIPFTVLIDKKGKIIQTNLRGTDLETVVSQMLD